MSDLVFILQKIIEEYREFYRRGRTDFVQTFDNVNMSYIGKKRGDFYY